MSLSLFSAGARLFFLSRNPIQPRARRLVSASEWHAPVDEDGRRSSSADLRQESMPRHVAVIMDGNRRWARARGFPVDSGYEAGLRSLRAVMEVCCHLGIPELTVFAFSIDNWLRPKVSILSLSRIVLYSLFSMFFFISFEFLV